MEREFAFNYLRYQIELRDQYIEREGILAIIRIPKKENEINFYGDFEPNDDWEEKKLRCIPIYGNKEHTVLDELEGTQIEENLPLKVIIKSDEKVYMNSLILIPKPNLIHPEKLSDFNFSYWRVLSEKLKSEENVYERYLICTPARIQKWEAEEQEEETEESEEEENETIKEKRKDDITEEQIEDLEKNYDQFFNVY